MGRSTTIVPTLRPPAVTGARRDQERSVGHRDRAGDRCGRGGLQLPELRRRWLVAPREKTGAPFASRTSDIEAGAGGQRLAELASESGAVPSGDRGGDVRPAREIGHGEAYLVRLTGHVIGETAEGRLCLRLGADAQHPGVERGRDREGRSHDDQGDDDGRADETPAQSARREPVEEGGTGPRYRASCQPWVPSASSAGSEGSHDYRRGRLRARVPGTTSGMTGTGRPKGGRPSRGRPPAPGCPHLDRVDDRDGYHGCEQHREPLTRVPTPRSRRPSGAAARRRSAAGRRSRRRTTRSSHRFASDSRDQIVCSGTRKLNECSSWLAHHRREEHRASELDGVAGHEPARPRRTRAGPRR